jgi:hypothetical protein
VIIDKTHRTWFAVTVLLLVVATVLYWLYANSSPDGPSGASWQGVWFGIAGSALMLFAGLLPVRKKFPRLRVGSAQFWLKGHIWLGLLSVPLIFYHAGFHWGGLLEQILLALVLAIVASGIFGLILQHTLPRWIKSAAPFEAIYEQVPYVCLRLTATSDEIVQEACKAVLSSPDGARYADDESRPLWEFYCGSVRPYLAPKSPRRSPLHDEGQAEAVFARVRGRLPANLHGKLDKLLPICEERRQLAAQVHLHHWLHGWLFIHLPLSMALLVLTLAHILMSFVLY